MEVQAGRLIFFINPDSMFTLRAQKPQPDYVTYRERYKVDLPRQMAECEANYVRLSRLMAHLGEGEQYRFMVNRGAQPWLQLQQAAVAGQSNWLQLPKLTVRMYHDAKLAEVLAWEGHKRLRPRYVYPNRTMYYADEKLQINEFLGELLSACLSEGYEIDGVEQLLKP
jgi:uncharacterized protein YqiB (DUF1249 family)